MITGDERLYVNIYDNWKGKEKYAVPKWKCACVQLGTAQTRDEEILFLYSAGPPYFCGWQCAAQLKQFYKIN